MKFLKASYNWLVKSSVAPSEVSVTIKGAAVFVVPVAIVIGKHLGYSWSDTQLASFVQDIGTWVAALLTAFGIFRKLVVSSVQLWAYFTSLFKK